MVKEMWGKHTNNQNHSKKNRPVDLVGGGLPILCTVELTTVFKAKVEKPIKAAAAFHHPVAGGASGFGHAQAIIAHPSTSRASFAFFKRFFTHHVASRPVLANNVVLETSAKDASVTQLFAAPNFLSAGPNSCSVVTAHLPRFAGVGVVVIVYFLFFDPTVHSLKHTHGRHAPRQVLSQVHLTTVGGVIRGTGICVLLGVLGDLVVP
mmetsp:Transcript_11675/g.22213  ORF Transcript_11675/g.22213 Transcript_11675/m.22213 type:complete len:207 (+) Transcript_11675:435-1055(+)